MKNTKTHWLSLILAALIISYITIMIIQKKTNHLPSYPEYAVKDKKSEPLVLDYYRKIYAHPITGEMSRPSPKVQLYWQSMIERQKLQTRGDEIDIEWVEVGPTNVGGRTRAIAIDRQNQNRLITGGVRGGIWISENNGNRWEHVKGITENESITSIIQHPNMANKWYASTGEYVGSGANFFGGGLLYSDDNGNNWDIQHYEYQFDSDRNDYIYKSISEFPVTSAPIQKSIEAFPFQYASRIMVHPDSNTIYVATHEWGILKSDDDMQSFTHNFPPNPERYDRNLLPIDSSTTLLLRFEGNLLGENGEIPLDFSEINFEEGVFGQGAHIDSFDILQYASAGIINSKEGTVEFWLKPDWEGDNNQEHVLLEFGEFPFIISFRRIVNQIEFLYARGDGEEWYVANANTAHWKAGEWHHIAFTWGPEAVNVYLDGSLASSVPVVSLPEIDKDFFQFGVPWGDGVGGVIDEFRISNRPRKAEEINKSFQFGTMEEAIVNFPATRPDFSDISIGSDGSLLAYLSGSKNSGSGVFFSEDNGNNWKDITPVDWPEYVERGIIQHAPSNSKIAYLLIMKPEGQLTFYKFDLENETFENRSNNLPTEGVFPGNYYLVMNVKPDDENFIVIGGVNLFRSIDAFANPIVDPTINYIQNYMHVDNHLIYYNPFNPDEVWAVNDGGIYYTDDITRISGNYENVRWQDKDNNYNVTQFYTVGQSNDPTDHRVFGGAQDNGYLQVYPLDPKVPWRAFGDDFGSDGAYVYVTPEFTYMSFQIGETYRLSRGPNGDADFAHGWIGISPAGAPGRDFIHQWTVDPMDENTMFYPIDNKLYRVDNIDQTPMYEFYGEENFDLISDGEVNGHDRVTALAVTTEPAHTLLFASAGEKPIVKKVQNAHTDELIVEDVSIQNATIPWMQPRCIAVNPVDGEEWLVVFTNFDVPGLYHTSDGGKSYTLVEGNLEGTDEIPGPTMEWAEILNFDGQKYYFLATHIGIFMTHMLDGNNTIWTHTGTDVIGYALALMVQARESDGKIVVGTHGRGFFAGFLTEPLQTNTEEKVISELNFTIYPNPTRDQTMINFVLAKKETIAIRIYTLNGILISKIPEKQYPAGEHQMALSLEMHPPGLYIVGLKKENQFYGIGRILIQ